MPSIAHKIYSEMKALDGRELRREKKYENQKPIRINLAGIALGNGWVDPAIQGPAVIDYAYYHGMIDMYTRENLHSVWKHCYMQKSKSEPAPFHQFNVPDDCAMSMGVLMAAGSGAWSERSGGPVRGPEIEFKLH